MIKITNNNSVPIALWNMTLNKRVVRRGITALSTQVTGLPHDNLRLNRFHETNICLTLVDLNSIRVKPFAFQPHKDLTSFLSEHKGNLIAWGDGFNNLMHNDGYWAFDEKGFYTVNPYTWTFEGKIGREERLLGAQTALIKYKDKQFPSIGIVNISFENRQHKLSENIEWAFGSPRIIRPGGEVVSDLLSDDAETKRPLFVELIGDLRQVVRIPSGGAGISFRDFPIPHQLISWSTKTYDEGENRYFSRISPNQASREKIGLALNGETIRFNIDPKGRGAIVEYLTGDDPLAGYGEVNDATSLELGQFSIQDSNLYIRLLRSPFTHSIVGTIKGHPNRLLFYKEIDDGYLSEGKITPKRNGFTYEDTSAILKAIGTIGLGLEIDQALEISEGGDPRFFVLPSPESASDGFGMCSYKDNEAHRPWASLFGFFDNNS